MGDTLDRDECLRLLAAEGVGRLAFALPDGAPDVVPVNFVLVDDAPVLRAHAGVLLDRVVGASVTIQVDRFDWFHRTGWSVLLQGRATLVAPASDTVRVEPDVVRGRRIDLGFL